MKRIPLRRKTGYQTGRGLAGANFTFAPDVRAGLYEW